MPQLANLVLTDRATTPVNHTFTPEDIRDGVASVVETTGVPIGSNRVSLALRRTADNGRYRGEIRYTFPIVQTETINGVSTPRVVRTAYATLQLTFDPSSTEQERKDAVGMVASSLDASKTLVNDMLTKLQGIY